MGFIRNLGSLRRFLLAQEGGDLAAEPLLDSDDPRFWYMLLGSVGLVIFAGLMSGLTLGLLSIEKLDLRVIEKSGDEVERERAATVTKLLRNEHLLLVTLLLCNAAAMEALPLVLHTVVPEAVAVVLSVSAVLFFGEIFPQAVCKAFGLAVGSAAAPLVQLLIVVLLPVTWPIAKCLDRMLGHNGGRAYQRRQISAILQIHCEDGYLTRDEETVMHGALELVHKTCSACMTPIELVKSLDEGAVLDEATLNWMLETGHSRIPVHAADRKRVLRGVVLLKKLLKIRPEDDVPVSSLALTPIARVCADTELYKVLSLFRTGRTHMAAVYPAGTVLGESVLGEWVSTSCPMDAEVLGVVTLEDVIEELLKKEIVDETDRYVHVEDPKRGLAEEWRQNVRGIGRRLTRRVSFGGAAAAAVAAVAVASSPSTRAAVGAAATSVAPSSPGSRGLV